MTANSNNAAKAKNDKGLTRGIRNNNPLNIRHSTNRWQGMATRQTDRAFVQFTSRKYGYRAAFVLIRNYIALQRTDTIAKIITRWAPSSDGNNTQSYIRFVSETSGIGVDKPLRFSDQKAMVAIVRSMAQMESAIIEDEKILNEAYCLAL